MTTPNATYQRSGIGMVPIMMIALALVAGAVALVTLIQPSGWKHAVDRHGSEPFIVRDCLKRNGTMQLWLNPATNRHAEVCRVSPDDTKGNFGARISTNSLKDDVTFFVFRKMHTIKQVIQYLTNTGYICISGC